MNCRWCAKEIYETDDAVLHLHNGMRSCGLFSDNYAEKDLRVNAVLEEEKE